MGVCAVSVALVALPAHADGDGTLGLSATLDVPGGGVVLVGAGTAGRQTGRPFERVELSVDLPEGAEVARAYLYVNTLGADGTEAIQVQLAGAPVLLDLVGTGPATCWGPANLNRVYRIDVTDAVVGAGTYEVAGVPSSPRRERDSQGVALLVLYGDPASEDITRFWIADGALALDNPADLQYLFGGLLVPDATHAATLHVAVGDGQQDNSRLLFGGTVLSDDAFPGALGPLYDVRSHDVLALLPARSSEALARVTSPLDCLSWNATVLTVTAPADADSDGDGIPDWTDECPFIPDPCEPPDPEPEPDVGPDAEMDVGDDLDVADAQDAQGDGDVERDASDLDADGGDVPPDADDVLVDDAEDLDADDVDVTPDVPDDAADDAASPGDTSTDDVDDVGATAPGLFADGSILGGGGCTVSRTVSPRWLGVAVVVFGAVYLRRRRSR